MINTDDCWLYARSIDGGGYGRVGHNKYAHIVMWEYYHNRPVPVGLEIDHLCFVRRCINPLHLEAVTPQVNMARTRGRTWNIIKKTHCPSGHEYTADNIYWTKRGHRICRTCNLANSKRQRERQHS